MVRTDEASGRPMMHEHCREQPQVSHRLNTFRWESMYLPLLLLGAGVPYVDETGTPDSKREGHYFHCCEQTVCRFSQAFEPRHR